MRKKLRCNTNGSMLPIISILIIMCLVFIFHLSFLIEHEIKDTVSQLKKTKAFHLADAGINRAIWKVKESRDTWDDIIDGNVPAGYDGTTVFTDDIEGGEYKITISSGASAILAEQVIIVSQGRDASNLEVRSIQVILQRGVFEATLVSNGTLEYRPNFRVHWGPVVAFGEISNQPMQYYPRKHSKGRIVGRDVDPTEPNTDRTEYWAFDDSFTNPPVIDMPYYINRAKNSVIPTTDVNENRILRFGVGKSTAVATPPGSGFFSQTDNPDGIVFEKGYEFSSSTSVVFVESPLPAGSCELRKDVFLRLEALIVMGDLDFNADGKDVQVDIAATAPDAPREYRYSPDAADFWDTNFKDAYDNNTPYTVTLCGFHGFIFAGGDLLNSAGNASMIGSLLCMGEAHKNTFSIYYNTDVSSTIILENTAITQTSWQEIAIPW